MMCSNFLFTFTNLSIIIIVVYTVKQIPTKATDFSQSKPIMYTKKFIIHRDYSEASFPLLLTSAPAQVRKQGIPLLQAVWSPALKGKPARQGLYKGVVHDKEDTGA